MTNALQKERPENLYVLLEAELVVPGSNALSTRNFVSACLRVCACVFKVDVPFS